MNVNKYRLKKFFNPMLGETYELVTEDFRFFAEQVSHHPPISAYFQEGKGYRISGFLDTKSKFAFGGGKGQMIIDCFGYQDYFYETYDETISVSRPRVYANNLVVGTSYIDFEGPIEMLNHSTGERAELTYYTSGWSTKSRLEGKIMDSNGNTVYKIEGSWFDKLVAVNAETGETITVFEEAPTYPDFRRMFGFNQVSINLNFVTEEMLEWLPPTDTRRRGDQRRFEQGKVDEADEEKIRLEVKQRKARKIREDSGGVWVPNFYRKAPHPFVAGAHIWEVIPERNYWERRETHDWDDLPDLWS